MVGDVRGRGGHGRVVGDVDADEPRAECGCSRGAALGVAGTEEHGVTDLDEAAGGLVAPQVPVLRVAEHDRHDDLGLLGRGIAHEPRVLHVERLGLGQRAGLPGDMDGLALAE